jgi:hypothetical protein
MLIANNICVNLIRQSQNLQKEVNVWNFGLIAIRIGQLKKGA